MAGLPSNPFLSDLDRNCQGARDPNRYFLALNVAVSAVRPNLSNPWSSILDSINAFDLAEIAEAHLGMINSIKVSSFCSPQSFVWGLDVAVQNSGLTRITGVSDERGSEVPVFDGEFLIDASKELFGRGSKKRFPLAPGTLCPTATRQLVDSGPGIMFSACGLGIPVDRKTNPVMIMEDVGIARVDRNMYPAVRGTVTRSIAQSVVAIGKNQGIEIGGVIFCFRMKVLSVGEIGCGLVMAPYFSLARDAMPEGGVDTLRKMSLNEWSFSV